MGGMGGMGAVVGAFVPAASSLLMAPAVAAVQTFLSALADDPNPNPNPRPQDRDRERKTDRDPGRDRERERASWGDGEGEGDDHSVLSEGSDSRLRVDSMGSQSHDDDAPNFNLESSLGEDFLNLFAKGFAR
jgi:hypothetical protein